MDKRMKKQVAAWSGAFLFILLTASYSHANVIIESKIDSESWQSKKAIYPLKGQKVLLKINVPRDMAIRWYQILPDISQLYKNANYPWDKNPYKWIGYAKIKYHRYELEQFRNQREINPSFKDFSDSDYRKDVGSFWIQAEVDDGEKRLSSPGLKNNDHRGLSPDVFRISIRDGDGYIGYLTSFFNVPGLFGSVTYQSTNYIGVDCADAVMAAYSRWKNKPLQKNYNVTAVVHDFPVLYKLSFSNGIPSEKVYWNRDIKEGDFIAVKSYGNQYFHIGALYKDSNQNGYLDGDDIVLHAGPVPLHYSSLVNGGFDGIVAIVRP